MSYPNLSALYNDERCVKNQECTNLKVFDFEVRFQSTKYWNGKNLKFPYGRKNSEEEMCAMILFKKEITLLFLQIFLIKSILKRRRRNKNKNIKLIVLNNLKIFWLESVEGILNRTQVRETIIFYEELSKVERSVSNPITTEFLKRVPSVKVDYSIHIKKYPLGRR